MARPRIRSKAIWVALYTVQGVYCRNIRLTMANRLLHDRQAYWLMNRDGERYGLRLKVHSRLLEGPRYSPPTLTRNDMRMLAGEVEPRQKSAMERVLGRVAAWTPRTSAVQ